MYDGTSKSFHTELIHNMCLPFLAVIVPFKVDPFWAYCRVVGMAADISGLPIPSPTFIIIINFSLLHLSSMAFVALGLGWRAPSGGQPVRKKACSILVPADSSGLVDDSWWQVRHCAPRWWSGFTGSWLSAHTQFTSSNLQSFSNTSHKPQCVITALCRLKHFCSVQRYDPLKYCEPLTDWHSLIWHKTWILWNTMTEPKTLYSWY